LRFHATTLALQVDLKSNEDMELVTIGEAARILALNTSALRYYEDRGFLQPQRQGGRRMYGPDELRRLDAAAAVLDEPSDHWRAVVGEQLTALDELIARANGAREFLQHALACPADHPVTQCPHMIEALDKRLAGTTIEQLAAEHLTVSAS
jgi:DNA-binding transcriptional MerR regulator